MLVVTHQKLCSLSARWLINEMNCPIVVAGMKVYIGEQPDVIGFFDGGYSVLIECKISRADFKGDCHKQFRWHPDNGMGDYRIYSVTEDVVRSKNEIPEGWGLIRFDGHSFHTIVKPVKFEISKKDMEVSLLVAAMRNNKLPIGGDNNTIKIGTRKLSFIAGEYRCPTYRMHPEEEREIVEYIKKREAAEAEQTKIEEEERKEIERLHLKFEEEKEFAENYNRDYPSLDGKPRSVSVYF